MAERLRPRSGLALVGDAARGIHPIAGQGWNLALRDVEAIAGPRGRPRAAGLDPGDAATLRALCGRRRFDSLALVAVTDGINRLFGNDLLPLKLAREPGLALVERLPPAQALFHAPCHGNARGAGADDAGCWIFSAHSVLPPTSATSLGPA